MLISGRAIQVGGDLGFLVDNETNQITAPAPLFDHGSSLFNFAGTDCWESEAALSEYVETLLPSVYDEFHRHGQAVHAGAASSAAAPPMEKIRKYKINGLKSCFFKKYSNIQSDEFCMRHQAENRSLSADCQSVSRTGGFAGNGPLSGKTRKEALV